MNPRRREREGAPRIRHLHESDMIGNCGGDLLRHDRGCPRSQGIADILQAIGLGSRNRDKQIARPNLAAVRRHPADRKPGEARVVRRIPIQQVAQLLGVDSAHAAL